MPRTKKKRKLSPATRAKLRRQARINFGHSRSVKRRSKNKVAKRRRVRRRSSSSVGMKKMFALGVGAAVYNAFRDRLSAAVAPITSKVPLGTIGDEAALAILGFQVGKRTKGMVSDVGKAAFIVEMSRIGVAVSDGSAFAAGAEKSSSGSMLSPNVGV